MQIKTQPLYQGRDWFSESWAAAQSYRALDNIHDLCLYQMKEQPATFYKSYRPLMSLLMNHMDSFQKNMLHLMGELIPSDRYAHNVQQSLAVFELQQLEIELKNQLQILAKPDPSTILRSLITLTLTIKEHLRKIDQ